MLRFLKQLIVRYSNKNLIIKYSPSNLFKPKAWKMASDNIKTKSDLNLEHLPVKKMKLDGELDIPKMEKRTVATMCGSWRGEEEDGGMILVFKTRQPCLSPDPTKESDYPENIEDFWEASLSGSENDQVCGTSLMSELCNFESLNHDGKCQDIIERISKHMPNFLGMCLDMRWRLEKMAKMVSKIMPFKGMIEEALRKLYKDLLSRLHSQLKCYPPQNPGAEDIGVVRIDFVIKPKTTLI